MQIIQDNEFHPMLLTAIKDSGLTRQEVAAATGYSEVSIRFFEHGRNLPPQRMRVFFLDAIKHAGIEKAERLASEAEARAINPDFGWSESELARRDLLMAGKACVGSHRRGQDTNLIEWAKRRNLTVSVAAPSMWAMGYSSRHGDGAYIADAIAEALPRCPGILKELDTLKGKLLLCHCHPARCHGDILAEAANQIEHVRPPLLPRIASLHRELSYNAESGGIHWKHSGHHGIKGHYLAGRKERDGSRLIKIEGIQMPADKIAWAMHHGEWPTGTIEHINGDLGDNRISNLRDTPPY